MRFGGRRLLAVLMLYFLVLFGLPACSGDQQQDEAVGQSDDDGSGDEGGSGDNQAAGDDNNSGGNNNAGDDNASADENGGGNTADAGSGNATENDLQDIIQEMNGQGSGDTAGAGSNAAPLAQDAPANVPAANNATPPAATAQAAAPQPAAEAANPPPFQPGGSSAGKGLPEVGSKMIYVVQKGDTLAKIATKIYGSGSRWNEMATLSQLPNPSRIFPGDLIYYTLDESAVPFATAYEAVPRSEEQVKQGDTLASIAKRVYGNPNAWRALWRENDKIDNPDVIPPGSTVYYVAQGAATAALKAHNKNLATSKSAVQGSFTVSKNNVTSTVKAAKVNSTLLAASQNQYPGFSSLNHKLSALN